MNRVKFIVAEKSYLVRKGIASIINRIDSAVVSKEIENLESVNSIIRQIQPSFIVINPNLLPAAENFRNFNMGLDLSEKGIAIISGQHQRKGMINKFREYIHIDEGKEEIMSKLKNLLEPTISSKENLTISNELSEREKTILRHVAMGLTNKEIAEKLFLSAHTVMTHRKNITNKPEIKTISGLTVYSILNNLISMDDLK
jgi:DNA-binding CsgD family transcriptional regulator